MIEAISTDKKTKRSIALGEGLALRRAIPVAHASTTPTPKPVTFQPASSSSGPSKSAMAGGAGFAPPSAVPGFSKLKKLSGECLSDAEIRRQIQTEHGWTPSNADLKYARKGMAAFARSTDPETQELLRKMRSKERDHQVKIHMVLAQILMGDIPGAMRSYLLMMDRDLRQFTRLVVEKLGQVREARSTVIRNFARTQPPEVYAGTDEKMKERSAERGSRYTQFVQLNNQLMNELQSSERELTDALQTQFRNIEQMWQQLAQLEEEKFRTDSRMART